MKPCREKYVHFIEHNTEHEAGGGEGKKIGKDKDNVPDLQEEKGEQKQK
jgi:hypothetical protein